MATIGLNALAQTMNQAQFAAALVQLKPRSIVIMDDSALAIQIAQNNPTMRVIHRAYFKGDEEAHLTHSPQSFMESVLWTKGTNVYAQALNEPSGSANIDQLVTWCVELMELGSAAGIKLVLPNFGVGNPEPADVEAGRFDGLLRAFVRYPQHLFALHEYFQFDAANESHLVGRYRMWLTHAKALNIKAPTIVMTEFGRDVRGDIHDGWRGAGLSEDAYADQCIAAMRKYYTPDKIDVCTFCFGTGFDNRWASFDVQGAATWLNRVSAYNRTEGMGGTNVDAVPKPPGTVVQWGRLTKCPGAFMNIRSAPNGTSADLGDLMKDERTKYADVPQSPEWYWVETIGNLHGWVSKLNGRAVITPEALDPIDSPEKIASDLRAIIGDLEKIAVRVDALD